MEWIIKDTVAAFKQGVGLLSELDNAAYTYCCPQCFNSSIGSHIRHNIDHCICFIQGYLEGAVDYDKRMRDSRIETDADCASDTLDNCINKLLKLEDAVLDQGLKVKMDCGSTPEDEDWSQSSVRRELQFLLSHTIHHYALISVICQVQGYPIPKDFGVAPSTLKHQRSQGVCAQ